MSRHVYGIQVDWRYGSLSPAEQAIVRRYEAQLMASGQDHGEQSIRGVMSRASLELPGRTVVVVFTTEEGHHQTFAFRGGEIVSGVAFQKDGMLSGGLAPEDYEAAGVESLPQPVYFPHAMLDAIKGEAARLDRSLSWVVQRAWQLASASPQLGTDDELPQMAQFGTHTEGGTNKRRQTLYFPLNMRYEMAELAAGGDHSISFVVQRAVALAWADITALPAVAR